MPTYIQKNIASDLSPYAEFNLEMSTGAGSDSSVVVSMTGSEVSAGGFISVAGVPNSDSWEDSGSWTVEIEVDVGAHQIEARCRAVRLDSGGTILQSGSFTAAQIMSANRVYTVTAPAWTDIEEDCDNRAAIEIEFTNTDTMARSCTLGLGTTENEVVTDITEDAGSCGGAPTRRVFIID